MVFNPFEVQFDEFIGAFENLCNVLASANHPLGHIEKVGRLRSAIERGSGVFNDVLNLGLYGNFTHEDLKDKVRVKILEMNRRDDGHNAFKNLRSAEDRNSHSYSHRGQHRANKADKVQSEFNGRCYKCGQTGQL